MSKEITIDYKGASRRVTLKDPGRASRMHQIATAPFPLQMEQKSVEWMNTTVALGTNLSKETVEDMYLSEGTALLGEVFGYWANLDGGNGDDSGEESDEIEKPEFEGLDLNDNGAVDLDEMR